MVQAMLHERTIELTFTCAKAEHTDEAKYIYQLQIRHCNNATAQNP